MINPIVSVLITSYNREAYIATAIESVLAQSMSDFELIICDNASKDRSVEIARRYENEPRVRLHVQPENIGQFRNRNFAASLARGKYLKYVDSDDAIYPHCLEVMTHMMNRHPEAGLLVCAWSKKDPYYPFVLSPREVYQRHFIHGERFSNSPLTTMYQRDFFRQEGGFSLDYPLSADYYLLLRMAALKHTIFAPTGLCFYRVHGDQLTHSASNGLRNFTVESYLIAAEALNRCKCPLSDNERNWALGRILKLGLRYSVGLALKKRQPIGAVKMLRRISVSSKGITKICKRRPNVSLPDLPSELNWSEFPNVITSGVEPECRSLPGITVILCGDGELDLWKKTLRSLKVQWLKPRILVKLHSKQSVLLPDLIKAFPDIEIEISAENDFWSMRNVTAAEIQSELIKFAEPGIIFYPYAFYLEVKGLSRYESAKCITAGFFGPTLYSTLLTFEEAETLDRKPGFCSFHMPLSCATFRSSFFLAHPFKSDIGVNSTYKLIRECAANGGLVTAHEGLNSSYFHFLCGDYKKPVHEVTEKPLAEMHA